MARGTERLQAISPLPKKVVESWSARKGRILSLTLFLFLSLSKSKKAISQRFSTRIFLLLLLLWGHRGLKDAFVCVGALVKLSILNKSKFTFLNNGFLSMMAKLFAVI